MVKRIIIVGLGRAGTSYLSRQLHDQGIPMWDPAMQPKDYKGKPHWEDIALLRRNRKELGKANMTYASLKPKEEVSNEFVSYLKEYKRKRDSIGIFPYGFKEPRISLLLSAYRKVFDDEETLWVCCVRNPINVGISWVRSKYVKKYKEAMKITSHHLINTINSGLNFHYFNYDGDINKEAQYLSELVGKEIKIEGFKRRLHDHGKF